MPMRAVLFSSICLVLLGCPHPEHLEPDGGPALDGGTVPDAGDPADAGPPPDGGFDAGAPDAGLFLDLRYVRGAPYTTEVVSEHPGAQPYALTRSSYALELNCDGGQCDYEFRSLDGGALLSRRTRLTSLFGTSVSRDGQLASLFEAPVSTSCTQSDGHVVPLWTGPWHLIDLGTGASRAQLSDVVTPAYFDPAFLRSNHHARLMPLDAALCDTAPVLLRETRAPYSTPPVEARLGTRSFLADELPDGRLINIRIVAGAQQVGVMDPLDPSKDVVVNPDADLVLIAAGFVHATTRFPAQRFDTYDLEQERLVSTELPWMEDDFILHSASGRYAVFCNLNRPISRCEVRDGLGEQPPVVLQVAQAFGRLQLALAGRAGFVTWVNAGQVWRRSLPDGREEALQEVPAQLRVVGDGRAVLASQAASILAVDATSVHRFEGQPVAVVDPGALGGPSDLRQAGTLLIITADTNGAPVFLHAWHVPSGRIARLTDSLVYNPPFQAPLTAAAHCEVPGFVRSAGPPTDSTNVDTRFLHFTEFIPAAEVKLRLWVMPVELTAPPRLIAELPPDACGTPLSDADGSLVWLPVPMPTGGVRAVMARP